MAVSGGGGGSPGRGQCEGGEDREGQRRRTREEREALCQWGGEGRRRCRSGPAGWDRRSNAPMETVRFGWAGRYSMGQGGSDGPGGRTAMQLDPIGSSFLRSQSICSRVMRQNLYG